MRIPEEKTQLHTIRQTLEKTKEYSIDPYRLFIDFKAVYDSFNLEKLLEAMLEFNIPKELISLSKMILKKVSCRIKILSSFSEPFFTEKGLQQSTGRLSFLSTVLHCFGKDHKRLWFKHEELFCNDLSQLLAFANE